MNPISTILIANRGEIAHRIIRTCRRLGIRSVAVYSDADRELPYVRAADLALHIGGAAAADSYLNQEVIIETARRSGADAIHPGYGFLSENAAFARRCAEAGIAFIGPNPEAIEAMGSKSRAKAIMQEYGVPVVPGYQGDDQSIERLTEAARHIGFPVLLKAAAGGGGKGMRSVQREAERESAVRAARREAAKAFGDEELIIEKYFASARHIEFQIFGDRHGNVLHLRERECSIQRRYQKVVEESPSPALSETTRQQMGAAAVEAARALQYDNAGTVEFIYVGAGQFYFLEVNTRLQVEHPVTELITGLDLVEWQIAVAEGRPLPLTQEAVRADGYALECRLYAEDARNDFLPVTGTVHRWETPAVEGLRYDSAVESGARIGIHYDPMIAKIIAHGPDRATAIRRMHYALGRLVCLGLTTNLPFLLRLLQEPAFRRGDYDTHYISREMTLGDLYNYPEELHHRAAVALTLYRWRQRREEQPLLNGLPSGWRNNFYQHQQERYRIVESEWEVRYRCWSDHFEFLIGEQAYEVRLLAADAGGVRFEIAGRQEYYPIVPDDDWYFLHLPGTGQLIARALPRFPEVEGERVKGGYEAPMPGEVIKVLVEAGEAVKTGDGLLILSSMKMENLIAAEADGRIEEVYVSEGQHVEAGVLLVKLSTNGEENK